MALNINDYTDQEIVQALLQRDSLVAKVYLYEKCMPLFKSVYNKYHTDCENVIEFINEIYLYVLMPNKTTGISKLAGFQYRCTLTMWLKVVAEHFCHHLFARRVEVVENISVDDRNTRDDGSLDSIFKSLNMEDVRNLFNMMPTERYRRLMACRYLEEMSNEDTARCLSLSMANYYNVHLRAKAQFCTILKKEGLL